MRDSGDVGQFPNPNVHVRFTERSDGDFEVARDPKTLDPLRRTVCDRKWSWLRQVHGSTVVTVAVPGGQCGTRADAMVTTVPGAVLAVQTADCAPVLLAGTGPGVTAVGAVHAGWRGLYDGVVEATVSRLRDLGAETFEWRLGPHVSSAYYEFAEADLTTLALRFGPEVVGVTKGGTAAFDMAAAVRSALRSSGIATGNGSDAAPCTASAVTVDGSSRYFSWRARGETGRQASLIWIEP